jgi:hypothetical protein
MESARLAPTTLFPVSRGPTMLALTFNFQYAGRHRRASHFTIPPRNLRFRPTCSSPPPFGATRGLPASEVASQTIAPTMGYRCHPPSASRGGDSTPRVTEVAMGPLPAFADALLAE